MSVLSTGSILGDFRIEGEVGRGGMGVVYRATQVSLGRPVALKVIAGSLVDREGFRERFVRESRLAASLDHPNVIPVFAAGEADGVLYIAMRYVDGTDLRALLAAEGVVEPARAAGVAAQVAAALDAAHETGLVHRDVKPANVLVAARGGGEHIYLTDFGLTKRSASDSGLTAAGEWVGTLDYVAPEQLRGDRVDGRADVYALGCVLYESLTGQVPFPREDDVAKLWAHISDPAPSVLELAPHTPRALAEVSARAMEKDPDDRFETAGDLGRAALAAVPGLADTGARARMAARRRGARAPRGLRAAATQATPGATEVMPRSAVARRPGRSQVAFAAAALLLACAAVAVALALGGDGDGSPAGERADAGIGFAPGTVAARIRVGDSPAGVAFHKRFLWVANEGDETVSQINVRRGREVRRIRVGEDPRAIDASAAGVWVANYGDGTVSRIDPASGRRVTTVAVGRGPTDVLATPGAIWVSTQQTQVVRVDPASGQVTARVAVQADGPLDFGDDRIWVADGIDGTMRSIDPVLLEAIDSPQTIGPGVSGIVAAEQFVWAAVPDEGAVRRVPFAPGLPGEHTIAVGGRPVALAVKGPSVWVADSDREALVRIDRDGASVAGSPVHVGEDPAGVEIGGGSVWVTSAGRDEVVRVRPE